MCLEEMHRIQIGAGALFYGKNRRRSRVIFDAGLRQHTEELAARMHTMYLNRLTPSAVYMKKCENCSLLERCLPQTSSKSAPVARYVARLLSGGGDE
jgi:CRISPR-associated exonuclease Cas4